MRPLPCSPLPRRAALLAALVAAFALRPTPARATDQPLRCGAESAIAQRTAVALSPADTLLEARLVFATFPDSRDSLLPVWADSLAAELQRFYADMSRGHFRVHATVVRSASAPDHMWRAPHAAAEYVAPGGTGWTGVNRDVLTAIANEQPGVWTGVVHVWMFHDQCTFACTDPSSPDGCEDTCPWAGISSLGPMASVPGFTGGGTTQRFLVRLDPVRQHHVQANVAAHEFGHRLGAAHTPGSDSEGDAWVNLGRYDLMRSGTNGTFARDEGIAAFHPLTLARWGWRPLVRLDRDSLDLRLPDLWSERGAVVEVVPRTGRSTFVLAHHGARGEWDARYGAGGGLHVWHVRRDTTGRRDLSWDLECAGGRHLANGADDPVNGRDALEADPFALGSAADFFTPGGASEFSALSNPASALHTSDADSARERLPSGVAIENLREDGATGDLLADVWVTPGQRVLPLDAGSFAPGAPVVLRWSVRPSAFATAVDVVLVRADSSERVLATALPNDGAWTWTADESGERFRLRLVSRDTSGAAGATTSEPFAVRTPFVPGPELALGAPRPQPASALVTVPWSLPAAAHVRVTILDPQGRRVCVLFDGAQPAGDGAVTWDGRDGRGARVRPGVYLVRFEAAGDRRERRIVWIE